MQKITVLLIVIATLLTACNLSNTSGNDEQLVSMQQTMDAMQSQLDSNEEEPAQANPPIEVPPTQMPPTKVPPTNSPTITPTAKKPSIKLPPTNTPEPLVPLVLLNPKILLLEFDNQSPMVDTCNSVRQDMNPFGGDQWREGDQLFGGGSNCSIRFELFVPQTGTYKMTLYATYAPDFANLKVYIGSSNNNTGSVTNISLYDPAVRPTGPIDFGNKELSTEGTYFINFLVSGKTASSSDYKFGIDYLTWEPVQ